MLLRKGMTGGDLCKSAVAGSCKDGSLCVSETAVVLWCCKALQRSYGSMRCSAAATGDSSTDTKFQVALLLTRDKRLLLLLF